MSVSKFNPIPEYQWTGTAEVEIRCSIEKSILNFLHAMIILFHTGVKVPLDCPSGQYDITLFGYAREEDFTIENVPPQYREHIITGCRSVFRSYIDVLIYSYTTQKTHNIGFDRINVFGVSYYFPPNTFSLDMLSTLATDLLFYGYTEPYNTYKATKKMLAYLKIVVTIN
jgi:hypothetical protein